MNQYKLKKHYMTFLKVFLLVILSLSMLLPFYWVLVSSFKSNADIFGQPFMLPATYSFSAFTQAFRSANIPLAMANSLFYSFVSISIVILIASMASYVLAKIRPNKFLYIYFLFGLLIPIHAMIIPLNVTLNNLGLGNSRMGLVMAFVVANISLSVFILTASMRNLPDELLQAAQIDGCQGAQVFFKIVLPVSKAALATVGTLAFVNCWNDFLLSMIIATKPAIRPLNLAVYNLRSAFSSDYNVLTAGMTTMIIPAIIIYTLFQEQIIRGMVSGAVKG